MIVNALRCLKCQSVIFSRARHDWRSCACGAICIDGGFDYMRWGGNAEDWEAFQLHVPGDLSEQDMYDDWNNRRDQYGILMEPKP